MILSTVLYHMVSKFCGVFQLKISRICRLTLCLFIKRVQYLSRSASIYDLCLLWSVNGITCLSSWSVSISNYFDLPFTLIYFKTVPRESLKESLFCLYPLTVQYNIFAWSQQWSFSCFYLSLFLLCQFVYLWFSVISPCGIYFGV